MHAEGHAAATDSDLCVVYADGSLVVLDKPSGLLSVPGRGADKQDCLSLRVQAIYPDALVVHRLDMSTSGLMVMARGVQVQRALSEAFASRLVDKTYEAMVHGVVDTAGNAWRTIDLPIGVDWPNRPRRVIDNANGKASVTEMQVIHADTQRQISHVRLRPLTGRTHQLRVHLQAIGHPILGDALYAAAAVVGMASRLMLHACELTFLHPVTGERMHFCLQHLKWPSEPYTKR